MKKDKSKLNVFLLILVVLFMSANFFALAAVSSDMDSAGPIDFKSSSSNYQFDAEVGAPAVGQSLSSGFIFDHGAFWGDEVLSSTVKIQWLIQELRVAPANTHEDMIFYLTFKNGSSTIYTTPLISGTDASGIYNTGIAIDSVTPGTYDVYVKGSQTLTKKYSNVNITAGENILNFTQTNVASTTKGSVTLLAGDVNGAGTSTASLGDDKVNAADLTTLLGNFNFDDASGSSLRGNLNHDTKINAADLTIVLKNFNLIGDN